MTKRSPFLSRRAPALHLFRGKTQENSPPPACDSAVPKRHRKRASGQCPAALPYRIPRSAAPLLGEKAFRATGSDQFPSGHILQKTPPHSKNNLRQRPGESTSPPPCALRITVCKESRIGRTLPRPARPTPRPALYCACIFFFAARRKAAVPRRRAKTSRLPLLRPLVFPVGPSLSRTQSPLSPRLPLSFLLASPSTPPRLPTTKKTRSVFRRNALSFAAFAPSPGKA